MCGRYSLFTPPEELETRFGASFETAPEPRYNCAPGQTLPVVIGGDRDAFESLTWGLVPSWADDGTDGTGRINARAETIREKPSFREAFERRRCLVPADGFYEWVSEDGRKRPYRVAFEDDRPFAMAGVWERWRPERVQTGLGDFAGGSAADAEPDAVESFAVVTTEPNDLVSALHHRMAVVLAPDEEETWLRGDADAAESLLDPFPDAEMRAYPVSTRVNGPANDDADLIEPVDA